MEHAIEIFKSIARQYKTCEGMRDALRNLNSAGELTNEEYDYLTDEWNNILDEIDL